MVPRDTCLGTPQVLPPLVVIPPIAHPGPRALLTGACRTIFTVGFLSTTLLRMDGQTIELNWKEINSKSGDMESVGRRFLDLKAKAEQGDANAENAVGA